MIERDKPGGDFYAHDLTWREQEILLLLAERLTNREIAERLHLAESTVKDYVGKILSKLYVKNRRQAVEQAKSLGLLETEHRFQSRLRSNLPSERTPFVGRADELHEIKGQLSETRLLTLTGPGGIGKTRLAIKVAQEAAEVFEDGRFFIPLAPIRSVDHIIQTIAEAVRFPTATKEDPKFQLLRFLKDKRLLLVMDNYEHLLDGVDIVNDILYVAPGIKILATSREKLNLQSESIHIVSGMDIPYQEKSKDPLDYDGINLFLQRVHKVSPDFMPSSGDLDKIVEICHIVQGMPLAIELAAAWLQMLTVEEILAELEVSLDILETEMRDTPDRHRSIRAVFNHSWSLLDQNEQETITSLSVFRGGFSRHAAQQVTGASLQTLMGLVNKSFLSHDLTSGRLEMHELLRQYTYMQLELNSPSSRSAQESHAAYYAEFTERAWQDLKGKVQMAALARIEDDLENVRTAWRYYLDRKDSNKMWSFIYGLWYVYWIRGWNYAGMELFAEAAARFEDFIDEDSEAVWAISMAFQGFFMAWLDLFEEGYHLTERSMEILERIENHEALVFAMYSRLVNAFFYKRYKQHYALAAKNVSIACGLNDKWMIAFALFSQSLYALLNEEYDQANQLARSNIEITRLIDDVIGSTLPMIVLGHVAFVNDELGVAKERYQECMRISQQVGQFYSLQTSSKYLAKVTLLMGDIKEAEEYLLQSLKFTKEMGFNRDIINLFCEFARLRKAKNDPEGAVELLAIVIQHPTSQQVRMLEGPIIDSAEELLEELEGELSAESFQEALKRGRVLDIDQVVAELLA